MACFIVPVAEAVITTVVKQIVKSKEKEKTVTLSLPDGSFETATKTKFSTKLGWLNKMLWLGAFLLAFEHVWHGEVVPFFPFLTAVAEGQTMDMLREMASAGTMMAVIVTLVWMAMLGVCAMIEKRAMSVSKVEGQAK